MDVARPSSARRVVGSIVLLPVAIVAATLATWAVVPGVLGGFVLFGTWRLVVVPNTFLRHHRRGVRDARSGQVEWALEAFRDSERAFLAAPWLDRHRTWLLGSANPHSFVATARYNQATCLASLGRRDEARALLEALRGSNPSMHEAADLLRSLQFAPEAAAAGWDDIG